MNQKYPIKAFDGTNTADVSVLNLPAGSVGANGEIDLGLGVKVYRALLTQTGTDAPVATVQENTLGADVTWDYDDAGIYLGTLSLPILTAGKTCLPPLNASRTMEATDQFVVTSFYYVDTIRLRVQTAIADIAAGTLTLTDELLANSYVQILVRP